MKIFIWLTMLVILLCPLTLSVEPTRVLSVKERIYTEVFKYKHPKKLLAIIKVESDFDRFAVSKKGAKGLTQIIPAVWHKELKEEGIIEKHDDYFDIEKNIKACSYILNKIGEGKKSDKVVLKHYSGGAKNYFQKVKKYENGNFSTYGNRGSSEK